MKFKVWIILFVFCITNFLYAQKTGEWSECGASIHECGIQYRTRLNKMEVRGCMKGKYWRTIPGTNTWFMFNKSRWRSRTTDAFYKAQASCVEYGAQLASITSKEEYKFIKRTAWDLRTDVGRKACWQIGLVRTGGDASQNGWHWLDGHSKTWPIRWAPRQPNDGKWNAAINHESEACIKKKNNIADINDFNTNFGKNYLKPYICKKKCPIDKCWCGQANSLSQRIINGEEANKNEFPWQVGLVFAEDNKWSNLLCGGSIISSKTILSAAHCTKRFGGGSNLDKLWVVVGEHNTEYNDGEQYYKVCKSFEHPKYNRRDLDYDYGILTLCEDLTWSKDVSPVCLPDKDSNYEGDGAIASGWGLLVHGGNKPFKLQKIDLLVLTKEECCRTVWNIDYMTPRMVCGGNEDKFICHGDSGGPLVVLDQSKNAYVLVGVSSFVSAKCGKENKAPSVFAKVSTVLDWIIDNMRGSQCS